MSRGVITRSDGNRTVNSDNCVPFSKMAMRFCTNEDQESWLHPRWSSVLFSGLAILHVKNNMDQKASIAPCYCNPSTEEAEAGG